MALTMALLTRPFLYCAGMPTPCIHHAYTMHATCPASCAVQCGGQLPPRRGRLPHRQVRGARLPCRSPGRRSHHARFAATRTRTRTLALALALALTLTRPDHARFAAAQCARLRILGRAGRRRGRTTGPRHARSLAGGHMCTTYYGCTMAYVLTCSLTYSHPYSLPYYSLLYSLQAADLVRLGLPDYAVTFSAEGY